MTSSVGIAANTLRLQKYCKNLSQDNAAEQLVDHMEVLQEILQVLSSRNPVKEDFNAYNRYICTINELFFYLAFHPNRSSWEFEKEIGEVWTEIAALVEIINLNEPRRPPIFFSGLIKICNLLTIVCDVEG